MALSPQLQQFKSSGVYRLEFDKSQTVNIPAETIRLVVGRSKKGPYNTPVFIEDVEQFIQVFGSIDKSLERKGMFFHRSAIEALSRGPILALNLTAADEDDTVSIVSPATNSSQEGLSHVNLTSQYSEVFDTDKFWTPNDAKLLAAAGNEDEASNHAISFVNIKQTPITIIVRQAANTDGFNMTAREWYGEGNIPDGIDDLDYVSDYMVDVLVFKGKFNAAELNNDPTYGTYFDNKGLFRSELAKFAGLREVELLAQYTGSLIPEFMDNEGRQLFIETLINIEARRTGLFCAVNEDALAAIDLVGTDFNIYQDYQLLSHRVDQEVSSAFIDPNEVVEVLSGGQMKIYNTDVATIEVAPYNVTVGKFLKSAITGEYLMIEGVNDDGNGNVIISTSEGNFNKADYEAFDGSASSPMTFPTNVPFSVNEDGAIVIDVVWDGATMNQGNVLPGHYLPGANMNEYVRISSVSLTEPDGNGGSVVLISPEGGEAFSSDFNDLQVDALQPYVRAATNSFELATIDPNARAVLFPGVNTSYTWEDLGAGQFAFSITGTDTFDWSEVKVGMYVPADGGKLAKIKRIIKSVDGSVTTYKFESHRPVSSRPGHALKRYEDSTDVYTMFPLDGATQSDKLIAELLTAIKPGTGLGNALIDKDNITFRYVVDTFGSLENGGLLNKEELAFLCKERQNASAILNAPMIKEFKASTNPSFLDENTGAFSTRYVATGGNLNLNPSALYTLPSISEGANYAFYYGPGLNVIENGRTKVIPPAAYVSNNYIDKYTSALPWSIIAGPRRGVVGGTGVQSLEFAFDKDDRDVLEPFGYNPIVFERGVGLTIKGNKTAQQSIQSALSSAHVREAMIYIEDGLAEILKNYLFEFNNAQTRLEIKTLADNFMESVKKDGGVYDYRNIMDGTNNTTEVIDNNMGILDTYVEPVKGLEILVSRVTILNTGEIATGNFA
jgi:hypothetical protein